MRIQWANRNVFSPRCWIGLAKSVITLMTPAEVNAPASVFRLVENLMAYKPDSEEQRVYAADDAEDKKEAELARAYEA